MPGHLVLCQPSREVARPGGLECPACSQFYGFRFRPRVTIKPIDAVRLVSGAIVIDNPTVICATCADRGVETIL